MSKKPTIAFDFDGTLVTHQYPIIGRDIGAWPWVRKAGEVANLILLTMRSDDRLREAVIHSSKQGVTWWGINCNPTQWRWTNSPKVYAQLYVDDAALGVPLKQDFEDERPFVDWDLVGPALIKWLEDRQ